MNKEQAIQRFWESFGIPAFDETSVPEKIWDESEQKMIPLEMPYITYRVVTDSLDRVVNLSGSLWYRSNSWKNISLKSDEIAKFVGKHGFTRYKLDEGYLWITKGTPFAQRLSDPNDSMIRRIYLNLQAEFLTAY